MFLNILGETSYKNNVIRGVLKEKFSEEESRYSILEDEIQFYYNTILGARTIIYK